MKKQTIAQLKQLYAKGKFNDQLVEQLKLDERKGVQALVKRYATERQKRQEMEAAFLQMCTYENKLYEHGYHWIAGVDEAGRGPLAGPVVAAAVILPSDFKLLGLNDSKKLSDATRKRYFSMIKERAISYSVAVIHNDEIDRINIFEATKKAMSKALNQLDRVPDYALIDAVELKGLPFRSKSLVKGDEKSISIAASSIIAKVTRDEMMKAIHHKYPVYDFKTNMGYGTKQHVDKLARYGPSPFHRHSFGPVKRAID